MEKKKTENLVKAHRISYFDICDPRAGVFRCEMHGFYILFTLMSGIYIGISATLKFFSEGRLLDSFFFWDMLRDLEILVIIWPLIFLYTWLAYILQLLIISGVPYIFHALLQHATQSIMFIFSISLVISRSLGFSQTIFLICLTFTHFMKMHSYTQVNRDLREAKNLDPKANSYPSNVTAKNFLHFLVAPVLVYQTEYPRSEGIRPFYFLKKSFLLFWRMCFMYIIASDHIIPVLRESHNLSFLELFNSLMFPFLLNFFMLFLVLFDDILGLFAEISTFADREFYRDWWNAKNYEEFNRNWNRPVHFFLYKHIYLECVNRHNISDKNAKTLTFLFSAMCHELFCALIFRTIRPFFFVIMMFQIPVIMFQKCVKNELFGIYLFWVGLITGPSLIFSLYLITLNN